MSNEPEENRQPEALQLAEWFETSSGNRDKRAAAELRRLHEAHDWQYKMAGQRLRRIEKLESQNQELVEALEMCIDNPWREGTVQYDVLIHEAKVVLAKARRTE
jgi:hypothetical protein